MRSPVKPFALLLAVAAGTFGLAQWHPFSPSTASTATATGSAARGRVRSRRRVPAATAWMPPVGWGQRSWRHVDG
ncbi:MAG: hypothetical protein H0W16_00795 [Actinobacteria bacterium]|nr:hypothetical protein [Actinomycetota bacterium]